MDMSGRVPNVGKRGVARHHHQKITGRAKVGAMLCASAAGVGTAVGLLAPQEGFLQGQLVPVVAGTAIAVTLAIGWHGVFTAAARARSVRGISGAAAAGVLLTGVAIGASSWAVSTCLGGGAALRHHQAEAVRAEERALGGVWANIRAEAPLVEDVSAAASSMRALVSVETKGGISKKVGDGPRVELLRAASGGLDRVAGTIREELGRATQLYDRGHELLQQMQVAITGSDAGTFAARAGDVQGVISQLDNIRLSGLIDGVGITKVEITWNGDAGVQRINAGFDAITTKLRQIAKSRSDARKHVELPLYMQITAREATLNYAQHVMGAWVTAISLDIIPAIFLVLVMLTWKERLLLAPAENPRREASDQQTDAYLGHSGSIGDYDEPGYQARSVSAHAFDEQTVVALPDEPPSPWRKTESTVLA